MSLTSLLLTNRPGSGEDPIRDVILNYLPAHEAAQLDTDLSSREPDPKRMKRVLQCTNWKLMETVRIFVQEFSPSTQFKFLSPFVTQLCRSCGQNPRISPTTTRFSDTRDDLCSECYFRGVGSLTDIHTVRSILGSHRVPAVKTLPYMKNPKYTGKKRTVWRLADVQALAAKRAAAKQRKEERAEARARRVAQKSRKRKVPGASTAALSTAPAPAPASSAADNMEIDVN